MQTKHERGIYQFLSLYRFFSFGIAVLLLQVVPLGTPEGPDPQAYLILGLAGLYTFFRVFSPLHWYGKGLRTNLLLGGDLLISIFLVLFTGGLDSGFLLYSLTPVVTAALLFGERVGLSVAAISSLSLIVAHLGLSRLSHKFVWVMQGNYLPFLVIFVMACFFIAIVAYRTNLNIHQRITSDAILEERRRIKQEMHDGVAQALGYLTRKTGLVAASVSSGDKERALTDLDDVREVVRQTYEDIREGIDQLSAEARYMPLIPAIASYVAEFAKSSKIQTSFDASKNFPPLSPVAEVHLMRIAQEGLTNIRKHALATEASVKLEHTLKEVRLTVRDNGRGLPLSVPQRELRGSQGLNVMRERAEGLGGSLSVISTPGQGVEISVSIPMGRARL